MDANEQRLISGLFGRMREMQGIDKDPAAADLIANEVHANPDAPYLLTQSVLVQEQALQKADERIKALEAQVQELRAGASAAPASVPQAGAVPSAGRGRPMGAPHQMQTGAAAAANENRNTEQQARGGGFMAQAMTTAAGVAGGMLLASGISSLFSGSSAEASGDTSGAQTAEATPSEAPAAEPASADAQGEDPALQDAMHDDHQSHGDDVHDASFEDDWGDFGGDFDL